MKKIYIGLSSPHKFMPGAALIQMWMRTNYSHAYVRFESASLGMSSIYQASHGMVHFIEFENFKSSNNVIKEYEIVLSDEDYIDTLRECMKLAGQKYGYAELGKILTYDIANTFGLKLDFKDGKGYICSELVGKLCADRLWIQFSKPKYLLTPKDIDIALGNNGYKLFVD